MEAWDSSNDTVRKYHSEGLVPKRVFLELQCLAWDIVVVRAGSVSWVLQGTSTTPAICPLPPRAKLSVESSITSPSLFA